MKVLCANKNFRFYFIGVLLSNIGDYMDDIAMAQIIYLITKSTFITSYVFAIKIICSLISIVTATVVDLGNKKRILAISCVLQALVILVLVFSYTVHIISVGLLVLLVTLQALLSTFMKPCQNAILPRIVTGDDIVDARALISMFNQFIQIFSYISAGMIILFVGMTGALLIDVLTFIAMPLLFLKVNYVEEEIKGDKEYFNEMIEGFKFINNNRLLKNVMMITFLGNFLVAPVDSLIVALISARKYGQDVYSLYMTTIALGGIITGLLYDRIKIYLTKKDVLAVGYFFGMISLIMLGIDHKYILYCSGIFIGVSTYLVSVMNASLIQIYTPIQKSARIFSIFKCISFLASPLGIVLAGAIGEKVDMGCVFIIYGIAMISTIAGSMMLENTEAMTKQGIE